MDRDIAVIGFLPMEVGNFDPHRTLICPVKAHLHWSLMPAVLTRSVIAQQLKAMGGRHPQVI